MNTLKAEKRTMDVKAKKLRREGFVTGVVYGREMKETIPLKMAKADVERLAKDSGKGSRIILDVEGEKINALIKEVDYNPMKGQIMEMDFQALVSGEKVHSVAEIHLLHHDKVTTGVLQQLMKEIPYKALPAALVEKIEIDVSDLHVGDSVKVRDLAIASDKDVELAVDPDAVVVTVSPVRNADIPEEESAAEDGKKTEAAK